VGARAETCQGSFARDDRCAPVRVQAVFPLSKPRFGKGQYASGSPHGLNGYAFAPQEGRSAFVPLADARGDGKAGRRDHRRRDEPQVLRQPHLRYLAQAAGTVGSSWSDARRRTITPPRYILPSNEGSRARTQAPQAGVPILGECSETIAATAGRATTTPSSSSSARASRSTWRGGCHRPGRGRLRSRCLRALLLPAAAVAVACRAAQRASLHTRSPPVSRSSSRLRRVPTEAVFVAMWFVLPVRTLPLVVCLGDAARRLRTSSATGCQPTGSR
jgi:hypothetical protein